MNKIDFYSLNQKQKERMLEVTFGNKGKYSHKYEGNCGDIYVFDQGENVHPRYVCAKIPKLLDKSSLNEAIIRFVNELENQLLYHHHMCVHWPYDFSEVMGAPVALFNYWGSDLGQLIHKPDVCKIEKLSIMVYICSGLKHCYENGLVSHQDLKPANIFLRNLKDDFIGLPDLNIYNLALIADFGLANAFLTSSVFDGSRPYMAPEQWEESKLSQKTDVFALGVILYELMTGGFHPIGIKLIDYWPSPINGNSKKWTRSEPWKKWAKTANKIFESVSPIEPEIQTLIQKMLSVDPLDRPSIDEVRSSLLDIIKNDSQESYIQLTFRVDCIERQASTESLKESWSYLWEKWNQFQSRFK